MVEARLCSRYNPDIIKEKRKDKRPILDLNPGPPRPLNALYDKMGRAGLREPALPSVLSFGGFPICLPDAVLQIPVPFFGSTCH